MTKITEHKNGFVIFDNSVEDDFVPVDCPVCGFLMKNTSDSFYYRQYGACFDCSLKWAEPNRKKWKEGWRPSRSEVKEEAEVRSKIIPKITFDL